MPVRHLLAVTAFALLLAAPGPALARDLLPDLDQEPPRDLQVATDSSGATPRFHLGFQSAVDNRGAGPLVISGHRDSQDQPEMVADQQVAQSGGGMRTIAGVGHLRYVHSEDHNHWHYLGFDHYELRRAADYALIAPDQKTGFCLGDRYDTDTASQLPGEPAQPVYTGYCGRNRTDLLTVGEGISVGYGDVYFANLEGQFVDVTGVPGGEYYLVHRVNADGKLLESDYSNDAASLLIDLSWPSGTAAQPHVNILRECPATDYCPGRHQQAPRLTRSAAERYARTVFRRVRKFKPTGSKVSCATFRSRVSRACSLRGVHAGHRYSLHEVLRYERWRRGLLYIAYSVNGKRGRVLVSRAKGSAAVAQPRQRFVAFDYPPLDGVRLGPVVH